IESLAPQAAWLWSERLQCLEWKSSIPRPRDAFVQSCNNSRFLPEHSRMPKISFIICAIMLGVTVQAQQKESTSAAKARSTNGAAAKLPDAAQLKQMAARFAPTPLDVSV